MVRRPSSTAFAGCSSTRTRDNVSGSASMTASGRSCGSPRFIATSCPSTTPGREALASDAQLVRCGPGPLRLRAEQAAQPDHGRVRAHRVIGLLRRAGAPTSQRDDHVIQPSAPLGQLVDLRGRRRWQSAAPYDVAPSNSRSRWASFLAPALGSPACRSVNRFGPSRSSRTISSALTPPGRPARPARARARQPRNGSRRRRHDARRRGPAQLLHDRRRQPSTAVPAGDRALRRQAFRTTVLGVASLAGPDLLIAVEATAMD